MRIRHVAATLVVLALSSLSVVLAQPPPPSRYLTPPQVITDMLSAPPLPQAVLGPSRQVVALVERSSMPDIAELARPVLRLAGWRIDPETNGPHRPNGIRGVVFKKIADGSDVRATFPQGGELLPIGFNQDGTRYAAGVTSADRITLWIADVATGQAKAVTTTPLNAAGTAGFRGDPPCVWASAAQLLCRFVVADRGAPPTASRVPTGPNVQQNLGKVAPVRTYEDMLGSAHDEALFSYYFTSQLAWVNATTGQTTPIGQPGIFEDAEPSPDGRFVLVARLKHPFSWLVPSQDFPKDVEIWDRTGAVVKKIADVPLAESVPIGGVVTGPRDWQWESAAPATVVWVEALDKGDPHATVPHRDRILTLAAPFTADARELMTLVHRFRSIDWTDRGLALVAETDRPTRMTWTWVLDAPGAAPRKLSARRSSDAYSDPGDPIRRPAPADTIVQHGDDIYLAGAGASPQGEHPFLDRLNLKTLATARLYRSDDRSYEPVVALLDDDATSILTRHESHDDTPNYMVRQTAARTARALTTFPDPAPQLKGVTSQLLTYTRSDGVKLSGTLYLPADYKPGTRLPLILWAYPREFTDANDAGQITSSPNRFLIVSGSGSAHLLFVTQGYAVLDSPTMPIIGPGETANDTYVEQLVASAKAAIDKVVAMGIADPDRVGVGGHSYGAFMTANLLAHSRLFRAGAAESGAYNRSLTPFGFQNERRTFWQAPQLYARMSPFWYANEVKDAILLTHGEMDDNSGTFPIQSERFYMALKGHGATVRYLTLPYEAHGYLGRESVLDVVAEELNWFNRYVKDAAPRETKTGRR
jgi:dipeptidyl aminopeptidase/acylaminoacyl peptidase